MNGVVSLSLEGQQAFGHIFNGYVPLAVGQVQDLPLLMADACRGTPCY